MAIQLVALDIYGTVLRSDDWDNEMPPRKGFFEFCRQCQRRDISIISASDSNIADVQHDLRASGIDLGVFISILRFPTYPKDFQGVIEAYSIIPQELGVIGDSESRDLAGARAIGCWTYLVPEYNSPNDNFDLSRIIFP